MNSQDKNYKIIEALTIHFPHLKNVMFNPQATFSQNLQSIIAHINQPDHVNLIQTITGMKQIVDRQQLKIQKSLVNQQPLTNITNYKKQEHLQIKKYDLPGIVQQSQSWDHYQINHHKYQQQNILQDIWRWDQEQNRNKNWYKN